MLNQTDFNFTRARLLTNAAILNLAGLRVKNTDSILEALVIASAGNRLAADSDKGLTLAKAAGASPEQMKQLEADATSFGDQE